MYFEIYGTQTINIYFRPKNYGSNDFQDYFDDAKESRVKQVPKNQESKNFKNQVSKNQDSRTIKFKIQEQSSFKNQDSRTIKIKIQDSRFKNQEKT